MNSVAEMQSADVMRAVAHELRQPLSTIESIAYYLKLILPADDEKIHDQLDQLRRLVEQSNWILSNGVQLTDPFPVAPQAVDLEELILGSISAHDSPPRLDLAGNLPPVRLDPGLAAALIENLLALFRQIGGAATLRTSAVDGCGVSLEICTPSGALGAGAALSLDSARRIVEAHGGSLNLTVDAANGIRLFVVLP